jgi:hypothetical protein
VSDGRGGRLALRHRAEHEIAPRDSSQELGEIVAYGERPAEDACFVADEPSADIEDGSRDVRLVHQRHRPMYQVELGIHAELAVSLAQQVVEAVQRLSTQRIVEGAEAAFDQDSAWHDVPCTVAPDVADCGVALHAVLLEALDDRVQPLDEKSLSGENVSAPAHHAAMSARS